MRSRARVTRWNLFFEYVSIGLMIVSGILLVPLYLRFIPIGLYGAWLATGNILAWLTAIDPGLSTVLQQQVAVAYGKKDFTAVRELFAGGLCITTAIICVIIVLSFILAKHLPGWLNLPVDIDSAMIIKAFCLMVIGTALMIFSYSITATNGGLLASVSIGIIYVIVTVFSIILTIALLYNGFGLLAIPMGCLFRGVGLILGNFGYFIWRTAVEKIGFSFSFRKAPALIKLTLYTFLGNCGELITNNTDLFILSRFLGPEIVPVLHLTRTPTQMSKAFVVRPAIAFMPAVSHLVGSGEIDKARTVLLRFSRIIFWLLGLFVSGFIVFNDDFVRLWVGSQLFAGQAINLILCGIFFFAVISDSLVKLCLALGNIKGNNLMTFIKALLFIPLVILGAKYLGILGIVLAQLLSILVVSSWYYPRSFSRLLKLLPRDHKDIIREILRIFVIIVPLMLSFVWFHPQGWFQFIVLVVSFGILYAFGLWLISKQFRSEMILLFRWLPIKFFKIPSFEESA